MPAWKVGRSQGQSRYRHDVQHAEQWHYIAIVIATIARDFDTCSKKINSIVWICGYLTTCSLGNPTPTFIFSISVSGQKIHDWFKLGIFIIMKSWFPDIVHNQTMRNLDRSLPIALIHQRQLPLMSIPKSPPGSYVIKFQVWCTICANHGEILLRTYPAGAAGLGTYMTIAW